MGDDFALCVLKLFLSLAGDPFDDGLAGMVCTNLHFGAVQAAFLLFGHSLSSQPFNQPMCGVSISTTRSASIIAMITPSATASALIQRSLVRSCAS